MARQLMNEVEGAYRVHPWATWLRRVLSAAHDMPAALRLLEIVLADLHVLLLPSFSEPVIYLLGLERTNLTVASRPGWSYNHPFQALPFDLPLTSVPEDLLNGMKVMERYARLGVNNHVLRDYVSRVRVFLQSSDIRQKPLLRAFVIFAYLLSLPDPLPRASPQRGYVLEGQSRSKKRCKQQCMRNGYECMYGR
ncbi:hypothetical protein V1517DRAFT_281307 [Lipomyces orientalis]|uniref:Uncharacterized protein n=1 Tax=Lipomyces orientalis TaxID=1233043 RepID=A0ACC3TFV3_9ASCO